MLISTSPFIRKLTGPKTDSPMPQRFLRPGLTNSQRWNSVGFDSQSLFVRLLTTVDDFGRCDGRPYIVQTLFATWNALHRDNPVDLQQVERMLQQLAASQLIEVYEAGDKSVIQITQWQERVRDGCKEKWPANPKLQQVAAVCCDLLPPSPSPTPTPSPSGPKRKPFIKPTIETLKFHCVKIGLPELEAEKFFNYYESKGWLVGKSPMKSWVGAMANWKIHYQTNCAFGQNGGAKRYVPNI